MFAFTNRTARRLALGLAAPAVMLCAGAAQAGGDGWRGHDRDRDWDRDHDRGRFHVGVVIQPRVVITAPPRPVVISRPCDEVPTSVSFAAYQSRDTVIIAINGTNRGGGFTTSLTGADLSCRTPVLNLRNVAGSERCEGGSVPFSLTASLRVRDRVNSLEVRVAGQTYCVPVTEACPL